MTGQHPISSSSERPEIGIFGGSGFEDLLADAETFDLETDWGTPSAPVAIAEIGGRLIAFLPRHGRAHEFPPHSIPYRANIAAMAKLGVKRIISPCAAGSLQRHVAPTHFVVCDQLVDRTKQRGDSFFDSAPTTHVSFADPYCPELRPLAVSACKTAGVEVHEQGTVVVIEGPRFSTRAESHWYSSHGWEVINMTQYPEAVLAREAQCCFVNISLITDYDAGFSLDSGIPPVTVDEVLEVFASNNNRLRAVLEHLVGSIPPAGDATCGCRTALDGAQL